MSCRLDCRSVEAATAVTVGTGTALAVPATLIETDDTAATLDGVLADRAGSRPTMVFQSIMWQYVPTAERWPITRAIEAAGERATKAAPLVRVSFEPDEFRRDLSLIHI